MNVTIIGKKERERMIRMREISTCGSGGCTTCPFSETDESYQLQNYACLPMPYDIIKMKETSGHNWSCHGDDTILCGGFARFIKEHRPDLDSKTGNLISYETWYYEGERKAIEEANQRNFK